MGKAGVSLSASPINGIAVREALKRTDECRNAMRRKTTGDRH